VKKGYIIGQGRMRWIRCILIVLITVLSESIIYSQGDQSRPSRQSALEAFSREDYEVALNEFSELLLVYSKDPLYKYYSGVCLVKLNRNPENAVILLEQALQGAAVIRTVPADGWFYLGRAQQMSGRFADAINSFNVFTDQSGRKSAREFNVAEYIHQCNERKGELNETEIRRARSTKTKDAELVTKEKPELQTETDRQPVDKTGIPADTLPSDYEELITEALDYQVKADSLQGIVVKRKEELASLTDSERPALEKQISEIEQMSSAYQKLADQRYNEAMALIGKTNLTGIDKYSKNISGLETQQEKYVQDISISKDKEGMAVDTVSSIKKDLTEQEKKQESEGKSEKDSVYTTKAKADAEVKFPEETEVFSIFEIVSNPVYATEDKIMIDPDIPEGLVYRIQVAVFRNPVAPSYFKGITPVYGFRVTGTDRTNYYAGLFRRFVDASKSLAFVKQKGFKDAFIVSLYGGKRVSSERAAILEKEWGKRPFSSGPGPGFDYQKDTIPPTLSFRVEVMRSEKPLEDDMAETIRKIAGKRGLDIYTTGEGSIVYLIGKFITFESASEYADLLVRNGYHEAKVAAWLGKREIPLDIARQLFENIE
jgi:tetratricopeptide (TPR) repeat protein